VENYKPDVMDIVKQMKEEEEIAVNNDQRSVWERKWFYKDYKKKIDLVNTAIHNSIEIEMLRRNFLEHKSNTNSSRREN